MKHEKNKNKKLQNINTAKVSKIIAEVIFFIIRVERFEGGKMLSS